jgi:phosphatidylinositol alpha-1,6-mannosyltransferase
LPPLRVLFVTTTYPLTQGDAIPSFVADLARCLVRDHPIEITVLAPHHPGAALHESIDGVRIERFMYTLDPHRQCLAYGHGIPDNLRRNPRAKWQAPGLLFSMLRAVRRHLPTTDLIHAHWIEPAFVSWLANLIDRKPLILTVHSLKPKRSRLHAFTLPRCDRVLFNSQYTLSQATAKGYHFRGQVVHQGYDDALFGQVKGSGEKCSTWNIPTDATLITAVGRLIEVKGMHILARSAETVLKQCPSAHLVIAGDGPERSIVEKIVNTNPHRDRIHLPGALSRQMVARLMADSDLFVNPGIIDSQGRAEGFGITTIEAMASGLPAIGSRVGGIGETIEDGVTGLLVSPNNPEELATAIIRLVNDSPLRRQMGRAGQLVARQKYSWTALATEVADVYQQFIPARRHSAGRANRS